MTRIMVAVAAAVSAAVVAGRAEEPPPLDPRLAASTLVREDLFAGFLEDDMDGLARGERTAELLLKQRPGERPVVLAWKGGATLYRAVRAFEGNRGDEFRAKYRQAVDLFAEAKRLGPKDSGVDAVTGGSYALFADRLPKEEREAGWARAYDSYQLLWKQQAAGVEKLPTHHRGELLGGLAQSAQRTGRTREAEEYVGKILTLLPDTPYEAAARRWKEGPDAAARTGLTCLNCHAPGRLAARRAALDRQK